MYYKYNNFVNFQQKNVLIIGKTGSGKSYFSNLLLLMNPQKQKVVKFPVYNKLESGTQICQAEINQNVNYGNETINLNILDTPGIFDTKDDALKVYQYQNKPQSIINIENLDLAASRKPFEKKFNKIFLVYSSIEKFDVHQKALLEQLKIMVGNLRNITIIVTRCQQKYDENESDEYNLNQLAKYLNTVQNYFKQYYIQDVYFITNKPISFYLEAKDQVGLFYKQQWEKLYQIKLWSFLTIQEKNMIGKFFNYRIGQTEEQKQQEHMVVVHQQQMKFNQNIKYHENNIQKLSQQAYMQQTQKIQLWLQKYNQEKQRLNQELEENRQAFLYEEQEQIKEYEKYFKDEQRKLERQYR